MLVQAPAPHTIAPSTGGDSPAATGFSLRTGEES
jgi:hypothetical protein